jgi:small subunit ribosomal protein S4
MPKRAKKIYARPRKLYDIALMKEEQGLIKKYGLKNRREVWKADFAIGKVRDIAKKLITASDKNKSEFIARQVEKGFEVSNIADVLGLNKENYLKRRLQSIVVTKGFAKTHNQARQLIVHKHISIDGHKIDSPAHLTTLKEEAAIEIDIALPVKKIISDEEKNLLKKIHHESGSTEEEKNEEAKGE